MSKDQKTTPQTASKGIAVPSKYHRLGSVANAPYFNLVQGNSFEGKLLGVFERVNERAKSDTKQSPTVKFFQIELLTAAEVKEGKGEEATVKQAEPGTIINLNCSTKTADLLPCAEEIKHGAEYNVFVHCGKKMKLANQNTMWDITVGIEQVKAPTASASAPDFDDSDDSSE
jgi:hypothetical protein